MTNPEQILYTEYKKLRNKVRATQIHDALFVVWNYIAHLNDRNVRFENIEVNKEFLSRTGIQKRRLIAEWEMHVLLREALLHSQLSACKPKTLRKGGYFADTINLIKNIQGQVSRLYISPNSAILTEMHRIAHQQFPWQISNPTETYFTRYAKIFGHKDMKQLAEDKLGLSIEKFYFIGMMFYGYFLDKLIIDNPPRIEGLTEVNQDDIDKFLDKFSLDIVELKERIRGAQKINEEFIYAFDPVQAYPLIQMKWGGLDRIICPDATRLFWRVTDGLYYELYSENGFSKAFGNAFQDYVGDVLKKVCENKLIFFEEEKYGSSHNKKDSVDWVVEDDSAVMMVECKTKRMRNESKTKLLDLSFLEEDLDKMAKFIVKTYKTTQDYIDNKYPSFPYRKDKKIYLVIVTLENWHVFGMTYQKVKEKVLSKLKNEGISEDVVSKMPFSIMSVDTFEVMVQVMETTGIDNVLSANTRGEEEEHEPVTVLWNKFTDEVKECKSLFPEVFLRAIPEKYHKNKISGEESE